MSHPDGSPSPQPDLQPLYARLQEVLGIEHAAKLMAHLPAEPEAALATKSDIADLAERVDTLAADVDRRFEQVFARFEEMDRRFERIDARFEQVFLRFAEMDRRFEQIDRRFERMDVRIDTVRDDIRDQLRLYLMTSVGGMTLLTAIFAAMLVIVV